MSHAMSEMTDDVAVRVKQHLERTGALGLLADFSREHDRIEARLKAAEAERDELARMLSEEIEATKRVEADAERLAEALEKANDPHEPGCAATTADPLDADCDCRTRAALAAHEEQGSTLDSTYIGDGERLTEDLKNGTPD